MSGLATIAAVPIVPAARKALRVCWSGDLPKRGDQLTSAAGRETYNLCKVTVLHRAEMSSKPRLLLSVTRDACLALPIGCIVHGWERTAAPVRPAVPANDRGLAPVVITPAPGVDQLSRQARDRRLVSEQATPAKAVMSVWDCPEDRSVTKTPKQIRSYRRGDVLGHMARSGCDVSRDMLLASRLFQCDVEIARLGFASGGSLTDSAGRQPPGPSLGPSKACEARAAKERDVRRTLACLGPAAAEIVVWVTIHNGDIASWCRHHKDKNLDRKKEMGRLLAGLTHLAEVSGIDSERERVKSLKAGAR